MAWAAKSPRWADLHMRIAMVGNIVMLGNYCTTTAMSTPSKWFISNDTRISNHTGCGSRGREIPIGQHTAFGRTQIRAATIGTIVVEDEVDWKGFRLSLKTTRMSNWKLRGAFLKISHYFVVANERWQPVHGHRFILKAYQHKNVTRYLLHTHKDPGFLGTRGRVRVYSNGDNFANSDLHA